MTSDFKAQLREAISEAIVTYGDSYDSQGSYYSGVLGSWDSESKIHMSSCHVKEMTELEEDFQWVERGYGETTEYSGTRARITCDCGTVTNVQFFVSEATVSTLLILIMMES